MVLNAVGGAIAQVGVEAVVGKLGAFSGAFKTMNNMIDGFGKKASGLSRIFEPVNKAFSLFFESLRRIGEFVVAGLILRGIDAITGALRDMAAQAIDAALEFQGLEIRLQNFLAADIMKSQGITDMTEALKIAGPQAEELFYWIQKIAVTTPFDAMEVADAFTMAKAWGFGTEEAKKLTQQVIDFTAGMGFSGQEMDRVIKALGQMKSLGRVAGQELLQLANAGVPVAEIMNAIREELGMTTDEFEALRMRGGVSAEMFFEKWEELVNTRFVGSAERMSRTVKGVLGNIKDLMSGILGFNVLKPVLDVLGEKMASFFDALSTGENLERLLSVTRELGTALSGIAELFLGTLPDPDVFAGKILDFLERFKNAMIGIKPIIDEMIQGNVSAGQGVSAILQVFGISEETSGKLGTFVDKLVEFKDTLVEVFGIFKEEGFEAGLMAMGVPEPVLNFFENLSSAWGNLVTFWDENGPDITRVLGEILGAVMEAVGLGEADPNKTTLIEMVGKLIEGLSEKLIEDGPSIVDTLERIGETISTKFMPAFYAITDWVVENQDLVFKFIEAFVVGLAALSTIGKIAAAALLGLSVALVTTFGASIIGWSGIISNFTNLKNNILRALGVSVRVGSHGTTYDYGLWKEIADNMWDAFRRAFVTGVLNAWSWVQPYIAWFIWAVKAMFGIFSPSKVFQDIGGSLMEGFALGIKDMSDLPELAMKSAVTHIIQPAMSPLQNGMTNNNQTIQNFNMNINTQAKAEPIISDFRMMQSLASGGL